MTAWQTARLESFCMVGAGGTPSRDSIARYYEGGTIPWVKSGELRETIIFDTEEHITEAALRETNAKMVPAGALLLAMYGATVGRLGTLGVPATTNQAVCHIIPDPTAAEVRYLFYALSNQVSDLVARSVGGAQPNISQGIVKNLSVPLPPLPEQRRIAATLDKADALRTTRRTALAQLNTLTQSIFLDMFGDPATNPKGWRIAALKDCVAKIQIGPFGSLLHQEDYVGGGIPLVNPKHIQGGVIEIGKDETVTPDKYQELRVYHLTPGDVVMGRRGEMGRCAIVDAARCPLLCGTGSLFLRPDNTQTTSAFLRAMLSSEAIKSRLERLSLGQTLPNLNSRIVEGLEIPLPPVTVQRDFADRVVASKALGALMKSSLTWLDTLFTSLQHRAFRGDL